MRTDPGSKSSERGVRSTERYTINAGSDQIGVRDAYGLQTMVEKNHGVLSAAPFLRTPNAEL